MQVNRGGRIIFGVMLVALIFRLPLAWKSPDILIPKVVSDDMFYYLQIAQNIAAGNGATADGENISNGFHFLYAALLVPLAKVAGDDSDLFLHLALSMLTIFSILAAWPLYRLLRACASEACAVFISILWLSSAFPVLICLSGVEVSVYVFFLGLVSLAYLKLKSRKERSALLWIALGLLASLAILSRIDGAILALIIAVELFFILSWRGRAVAFGVGTVVGVVPWFIWSYIRTGFILQVSGKAIRYQTHLIFLQRGGGAGAWLRQAISNLRTGVGTMAFLNGMSATTFLILCAALLVLLLILALSKRDTAREWVSRIRHLLFLPVYGLITLLLYSVWLWYTQNWYYYSIFFSGCVALGMILDFFDCRLFKSRNIYRVPFWSILFIVILISSARMNTRWWQRGLLWWQTEMYQASLWSRDNLPPDAKLGSFNSGILGYYSGHKVINLDGVVNPKAYRAMLEGKSFSYIKDEKIRYLVEMERSLLFRSLHCENGFLKALRPLHRERLLPENNVAVYEIK